MDKVIHVVTGVAIFAKSGKGKSGKILYSKFYTNIFESSKSVGKEEDGKGQKKRDLYLEELRTKVKKLVKGSEVEICSFEKYSVVFQAEDDLMFCVIGKESENELVLSEVLTTWIESLNKLFENKLEKRTLLENFDLILLTLDELIDEGIFLENESSLIAQRVDKTEGFGLNEDKDPVMQVINSTKKSLTASIKGFTSALFG